MPNKYKQYSKVKDNPLGDVETRECLLKLAFETEAQAENFLIINEYQGVPYLCSYCHMWHNTTKR